MFDDPKSHGLWAKTAAPAPRTQALLGEKAADVAIVGAGYTGLSAALHLAEQGAEVVVLEAAEIGFGGAGRNVGLVNAGMWVMPEQLTRTLGTLHGERLLDQLGDGPQLVFDLIEKHGIDCEAVRKGTLHCAVGAAGRAELEQRAAQWQARGAPVELLSASRAAALLGTDHYAGALLDPRAGTIQPLSYARGLARAAIAAGATIHTSSPVSGLKDSAGRWTLTTDQGRLSARWVVLATDAYTERILPGIRTQQVFLPYFNLATSPLPEELRNAILPQGQGAWDTKEILSSFRMDQAGRLIFGSVGALTGTGAVVHRDWARRALRKIYPQLRDVTFETGWHGKIGLTRDNLPRFHRFGDRAVATCGYNGRGISPGTVFGRALARLVSGAITEGDMPLPLTQTNPQPFRHLQEGFYEIGAQVAHFAGARF